MYNWIRFGSQFTSDIIHFLRMTEHPVGSHSPHRASQQELQILGTFEFTIQFALCCCATSSILCPHLFLPLKNRPGRLFVAYNFGFTPLFFALMMWNLIKALPVQLVFISIEDKNSAAQVFVSVTRNESQSFSFFPLLLIINHHRQQNLSLWDRYLLLHWQ